jgi:hypothetical protein
MEMKVRFELNSTIRLPHLVHVLALQAYPDFQLLV